ncbi:hypothetical protein SASPL_128536 [Salvia splendens]|uniref:Uncharacterized protein n=1 Tax=Salvia splendens TaxID=180675 RepID=A0A8X8X9P7_SALSN|nr:hypothetical protein SASPL_128536 [Salvia splendens]
MLHALGELHDPLLRWFRSHPSPPTAIISDLFLGWTHHLASQLSILRYVFSPCGALAISIINSLWCEMPTRRNRDDDEDEIIQFPKITNSSFYPWWQLSPLYQSYVEGDLVLEFIKDSFRANTRFEDRVVGRGVVIRGWALQVVILRHEAMGAYFTQRGWNSTLESITARVPMMAWPMGADQFVNATLIENELNIGVRVFEGDRAMLGADELAQHLLEATSHKWTERRARSYSCTRCHH